jgi:hypothetical protein
MRRIIIDLLPFVDQDEAQAFADEIDIRFQPHTSPRVVDVERYSYDQDDPRAKVRTRVWQLATHGEDGETISLTKAEAEQLWLSILQDSRSVAALRG